MAKRKQFTFYESFYRALAKLPAELAQQGAWVIATYALYGQLPEVELDPAVDAVFEMAKPVLDAARKKSSGAMNSQEKQKSNKEQKSLAAQSCSVAEKQDVHRIAPGCPQDSGKEGEIEKENEVEVEIEVENEVEVEIEKELEKESLYTDGVCVIGDTDTDRFERFWSLYPNQLGKQKAWEVWQMEKPDPERLLEALECWKRSRQWTQDNGRFIPKAENFLKERYHLQAPKKPVPMGASGHLGKAEMEAIERLMHESD